MHRPTPSRIPPESPLAQLDAVGHVELEQQLGAWQRRRVLIYFAVATLLLGLSTATGTFAWPTPAPDRPDDPVWRLDNPAVGDLVDTVADGVLTLIFLTGLLVSVPLRRTHREVVRILQVTLVAATVVIVGVAPFAAATSLDAEDASTVAITVHVAVVAAAAIFLLHLGASALVALSPREALRPLIPMALVFGLVVLAVAPVAIPLRLALATLGALAGLPGLLWSVARYRRFQERFVSRFLHQRVGELDRDLQHARRLHESLLPLPIQDGPVRVSYHYEPMQAIGGDFLTLRRDDVTGHVIALVADVTGHGIAAALAVNRLHGEIDRLLAESPGADPATILAGLNRYACAALSPQGIFVTAVCIRIDPERGSLQWANAGHPPALLVRARAQHEQLGSGGCMLGVLEPELYEIALASTDIARGDRVLVYTDGASEAFDAEGRMFGIEGILAGAWAQSHAAERPAHALADAITRFRDGPPRDDLLAVDIAFLGSAPASSSSEPIGNVAC